MPNRLIPFSGLILLAAGLPCGAADVGGPLAGYAAGASGAELRAITGVPGSYRFSDPLALPEGVERVHLAAGQDFALAERGGAGLAVLYLDGGAATRLAPIDGAMPAVDWAAFSNGGAAAVLYSSSASRLQVLAGLPGNPRVALDLDSGTLAAQPLHAALSDDAAVVLLSSGNAVYRLRRGASPELVLSAGNVLSLVLLPNGTDAVVADRSTASIHFLANLAATPSERIVVSGLSGMAKLYPAADGASVFVARPGVRSVSSVDLATGEVRNIDAGPAPVDLLPLRQRDTFLISSKPGEPGGIFFRDGDGGRVVWIPAIAPATARESVQ